MNVKDEQRERYEDLKVERALFGLSEADATELHDCERQAGAAMFSDMDEVAARAEQAMSRSAAREQMPTALRDRVKIQAVEFFAGSPETDPHSPPSPPSSPSQSSAPPRDRPMTKMIPWLIAAAASLVAVLSWAPAPGDQTVAAARTAWLAETTDVIQEDWSDGPTAVADVSGDVVWSPEKQAGFMRFRNLPVNDPTKEQYQLWIFAKNQSEATPIDGGVFDISKKDSVVRINPKLFAEDVYLFAVTIEKPGGVVVSSRERLPLVAKVE